MSTASPLGVQLYSVRDSIGADELPQTLERLTDLGFTHVEPYDILSDTEALADAIQNAGLQATSAHAKITELDSDAVLDAAERLGLSTVIVPMVPPASIADRSGVSALAGAINALVPTVAARGIRLGYHNHDFEFSQKVEGRAVWEILVELLDPSVVLELDTYWASVGGADVFDLLSRHADRIRYLHVRNQPEQDALRPILGVPVTGRQGEILQLARGFLEMPVVEVVVHEGDVFPLLAQNADFFAAEVLA
ncbi:MAG: sugar phosphate isomerase/epimerase [Frondihabitans sp.]|nr:sugar phosphate isomerase/epimerase [Frondihabitans sp.]